MLQGLAGAYCFCIYILAIVEATNSDLLILKTRLRRIQTAPAFTKELTPRLFSS
jgi:hypothetical protein